MSKVDLEPGYEHCPDCGGTQYVTRIIRVSNGFTPGYSSIEPCGRCGFTGLVQAYPAGKGKGPDMSRNTLAITPEDELSVAPLSDAERRWLVELNKLFARCPERLLVVECADGLFVTDKEAGRRTDLHDGKANEAGIVLAHIGSSIMKVTSASG